MKNRLVVLAVCLGFIVVSGRSATGTKAANRLVSGTTRDATQAAAQDLAQSTAVKPGDVDTVEHLLAAVYDSISGPAGPRNWERFRALFYPGARLIPSFRDKDGKVQAKVMSVEDYVQNAQPFFDKEGFFEAPIANRTEQWDRIAHVWSTYESRHAKGEKPFARGINSFQFLFDGSRWWVVTIYWEGEEKEHPLPDKYLK